MASKLFTEFFGSFLFMIAIALAAPSGHPLTPLAIGAALLAAVYMGGPVSGAHYNPAVTVAIWMQKKISLKDGLAYILMQLLGAAAAFCLGAWICGIAPGIAPGVNSDGLPFSAGAALLVEVLFTCLLALVVLNVACTKKCEGNSYFGLAIGMTIVGAVAAGGAISGGAFNPAVGFGATLAKAIFEQGAWDQLWIYLVGPILGGALGATVYGIQHATDGEGA